LSRPPIRNKYFYCPDHITWINEDAYGHIWIATFTGGINRYDPATGTVQFFGADAEEPFRTKTNEYWCGLKAKDNLMWLGVWQDAQATTRFYRISVMTDTLSIAILNKAVYSFAQDRDRTMWFGTNRGLLHLTKENKYDSFLVPGKSVFGNLVLHLEQDPNDNLWISTFGGGLFFFDEKLKTFTGYHHTGENSLASDTVSTALLDDNDKVWIGTYARGLDLLNSKTGNFTHYRNISTDSTSISCDRINAIKKDKKGNVWVAVQNGSAAVNRYDNKTGKFKRYLKKMPTAYCIFEDHGDKIWVGTLNFGLQLYDPVIDNFGLYLDSNDLVNKNLTVWGIAEDTQNHLWLNTDKGLIQLDPRDEAIFAVWEKLGNKFIQSYQRRIYIRRG
jgi:ligand-binding sensor domain-containing protein